MDISTLSIIVNFILLALSFIIAALMLRLGSLYSYNYGNSAVQEKLKWRILRLILLLIAIGLIASVFNIVMPFLA